jgi:glycerophosphoryl diester phosphodiesterase
MREASDVRLRFAVAALAAAAFVGTQPASAQEQPPEDPRIEEVRRHLDVLDDSAVRPPCDQQPDPERWSSASPPDRGSPDPVISAHRGALTLAPENTLWSYEYAFAYGVDLVEVDIQQTEDGRFVALHDATVDRTTDGTGAVNTLTYDEVRALNAADYEPWKGGEFDPARVASVEEVLALAARVGGGLELDIKGSVTDEDRLAELVQRHGLIEESVFNSADARIFAVAPGANLIYNRDTFEPPALVYEIALVFGYFGSRLDEYSPESIAAVHDGCGIVMPHAYDAGPENEVAQFHQGRAIGADGVQTNQPDAIIAAAGMPAASRLRADEDRVCLTSARHHLGFPGKQVEVRGDGSTATLLTGKGGCAALPLGDWAGARVTFAGDGSVLPSSTEIDD